MASKQQQAVGAALDDAAILSDGRAALVQLELLIRAISRRNLWCELTWDSAQAEAEALRDVARLRRALEQAGRAGE